MPDIYSLALLAAIGLALLINRADPLRFEGALVILASWIASNAAQIGSASIAPVYWFVAIDVAVVTWFSAMISMHSENPLRWALWAAIFHVMMLCVHAASLFVTIPQGQHVVILNALMYSALIAISRGSLEGVFRERRHARNSVHGRATDHRFSRAGDSGGHSVRGLAEDERRQD